MSEQEVQIDNNQEQVTTQQKIEKKQPSKKLSSYTYWVDQNNKSRVLPPEQRPQKIDPPKLQTKPSDDGRSNWNTAGTWEHKKISLTDIEKQYTDKLNQWVQKNIPEFKLKKVSLNGQCELVFIRMKKALTYQINGKVEFQKKPQQVKEQQKQKNQEQTTEKKQVKNSSEEGSGDDSSEKSSQKQKKKDQAKQKPKKSAPKSRTMTLQLVDLTDTGDRQYKSKADDAQCKKLITQKSNNLVQLLEEILKSYK